MARVSAFVAVIPMIGGRNLPRLVKVGFSVSLAAMWFGAYGTLEFETLARLAPRTHWLTDSLAVGREVVIGAALGYALGLVALPARIAGAYIGQEMGLNLATISDPTVNGSTNVLSQVYDSLGTLVFFAANVHHVVLAALHLSFERCPVGTPFSRLWILPLWDGVARAHELGMLLAAPLAVCLFATLFVLLLMGRAAPQFNLFSVGLTLRLGVGLVGSLVFLPELVAMMRHVGGQSINLVTQLGL